MDIITHLVFGALMFNLFLNEVTFNYFIYAMVFAILPDLDIFLSPLRRKFKSDYLEHRSGSHSYIIGVIISTIIGSIYSILTHQSFFLVWLIGIIFYSIHISLDLLNTTKIPCFYPLSKKEYCFYVEKAGSSFTLLTSTIFIISGLVVFNYFPSLFFIIININTFFMVFYYLYRIITKIQINSRLNNNQKYLPGVLPFIYYVFEEEVMDNSISLQILKKSHFSRSKSIYMKKSNLTQQEMEIFNKGIELCMENYYYAKWTFLPIFVRNEGTFSIRFFFLEPMVHSRAMYIQYNFDLVTEIMIGYNQSFGRFNHS